MKNKILLKSFLETLKYTTFYVSGFFLVVFTILFISYYTNVIVGAFLSIFTVVLYITTMQLYSSKKRFKLINNK